MFLKYLKSLFSPSTETSTIEDENSTYEIHNTPIKIQDKSIQNEIKTVHIHVYDKEKIIVNFFQSNGLENKSKKRNGKYSPELVKHYHSEFSTLGYKVKIHNYVTSKNNKQKITNDKKVLKEVQPPKYLTPYEIGIVQSFDDQLGYGFIKSRLNIDFFVHKTQLNGLKIAQGNILIFKCERNEKGNYADEIILLENNKESLIKFIEFNDKYRKINRRFFESQSVRNLCQIFFYSTYIKEIPEDSFINIISSCANKYSVIPVIVRYMGKSKIISSSLEEVLISNLTDDNFTHILKSEKLNLFLKNPKIIEKLNQFPSFIKKKLNFRT